MKSPKLFTIILSLAISLIFGTTLLIYNKPMDDVSLNLSLGIVEDGALPSPGEYDNKGWTVFTQEGQTVTLLEPDGFGGYTGLELGQTFYFSRPMTEELDSPTLQLGAVNRTTAVWLDDALIYTDCPELDNRVGHLRLPMLEWDREEFVIISLPPDYQGKTLTIAQSFPEYTETGSVRAFPMDTLLYCGYAYESGLISESFRVALLAVVAFVFGCALLFVFVRTSDYSHMSLALVIFLWMVSQLVGTSFFWFYHGTYGSSPLASINYISNFAALLFLVLRAEKRRGLAWGLLGLYGLSLVVQIIILSGATFGSTTPVAWFFESTLPQWLALVTLVVILVQGVLIWRKESPFYRMFCPVAGGTIVAVWLVVALIVERDTFATRLLTALTSGIPMYLLHRTMLGVILAALITSITLATRQALNQRIERQLLQQRQALTMESFESMRRQHQEVMLLRHDMHRHYNALRGISTEPAVRAYLDDLLGQEQQIRPIVQSGNQMMDIIVNSKLSAAIEEGITPEQVRVIAPESLPLSDADLCSLVMNIMDNALTAAANSGQDRPFIRLDIHVKGNFLVLICENSTDPQEQSREIKEETVPEHGLGLRIIRSVVTRYDGVMDVSCNAGAYRVQIVLPLL